MTTEVDLDRVMSTCRRRARETLGRGFLVTLAAAIMAALFAAVPLGSGPAAVRPVALGATVAVVGAGLTWASLRDVLHLPLIRQGNKIVTRPLTLTQALNLQLPEPVELERIELEAWRDAFPRTEDAPGRVHWYDATFKLPDGTRMKYNTVHDGESVYDLLTQFKERGKLDHWPQVEKVLTLWDADAKRFRTPGGRPVKLS